MTTVQNEVEKTESLSRQFRKNNTTTRLWERAEYVEHLLKRAEKEWGGDFMRDEADHATKQAFRVLHNHLAPQYFKDPNSVEIDPIAFADWVIGKLKELQPRTYDQRITGFAELLEKERDWIASGGTAEVTRYTNNQMPFVKVLGLQYG